MKNIYSTLTALLLILQSSYFITTTTAQNIGINSTGATPDASAMLDVAATNRGLLIPRVALTSTADVATIATPATSLLVYNTATAGVAPNIILPGYYYWNGTKWISFGGAESNNWGLLGNAGTVAGTNFIGTTDDVDLVFKRNGVQSGLINDLLSNSSFGVDTLNPATNGEYNTATGARSLHSNTDGDQNTASGSGSMYDNTTGSRNTGIGAFSLQGNIGGNQNTGTGAFSLQLNSTGNENTATGAASLRSNSIGSYNTAVGYFSLQANTTGSNNVGIGYRAGFINTTGSNNTFLGPDADASTTNLTKAVAIGYNAKVAASNSMVLGGAGTDVVKVGIATTTPLLRMHIRNDVSTTNAETPTLLLDENGSGVNNGSSIQFRNTGSGYTSAIAGLDDGGNDGRLEFRTSNDNAITAAPLTSLDTKMTILQNGNIGIGAINPATRLDVASTANVSASFTTTSTEPNGVIKVVVPVANSTCNTCSEFINFFKSDGTVVGFINADLTGNSLTYNTTSDQRLKENIHTTAFGIKDLMKIQVADYNRIGNATKLIETGYIGSAEKLKRPLFFYPFCFHTKSN